MKRQTEDIDVVSSLASGAIKNATAIVLGRQMKVYRFGQMLRKSKNIQSINQSNLYSAKNRKKQNDL